MTPSILVDYELARTRYKLARLDAFILDDPAYKTLPPAHQTQLVELAKAMGRHTNTLHELKCRVDATTPEENTEEQDWQ